MFIAVFAGEEPRDENLEELEALQKRLPRKWEGRWPVGDRMAQRWILQDLRREAEWHEFDLVWERQVANSKARIQGEHSERMAELAALRAENDKVIKESEAVRKRVGDWLGIAL